MNIKILIKTFTLCGIEGFSRKIIKGIIKNIATKNDPSKVAETTIGIGFINSPMIPLANNRGTNAKTVVIVVVRIAIK
ncbi:MAG: hypothetical protein M1365_15630, partial [Actinobacteria bacterium]|nr:hypothetical protein [Actinomycetota bacterium]